MKKQLEELIELIIGFDWRIFISLVILTFLIAYINGSRKNMGMPMQVVLAVLLVMDGVYLIKYLFDFFAYLKNLASSVEKIVLVALITGCISLVTVIYTKYTEGNIKKREYLSSKREEPYYGFIELVYKVIQSDKKEYTNNDLIKDINKFGGKISLWGSPEVVKNWNEFRKNMMNKNFDRKSEKNLQLLEDIMNHMRKDLGVKSIRKGKLLSYLEKSDKKER